MLFVRLSYMNMKRNLSRSLLAILGMAVAAGVFTGVSAMRTGYPSHSFLPYRQFAGADIVGYSDVFPFQAVSEPLQFELQMGRSQLSYRHDLATYFPAMNAAPYLHGERPAFDLTRLQDLINDEQVTGVYPYLALPVLLVDANQAIVAETVLRGRYAEVDSDRWDLGYFAPEHEGELVCVTNQAVSSPSGSGLVLSIEVPSIVSHTPQGTVFDYSRRHHFQLQKVGEYVFVVGTETMGEDIVEIYLENEDIFIPARTWHHIFEVASEGNSFRYAHQLGMTVDSMFLAKETRARLADQLKGATVLAIPELAAMASFQPPAASIDTSSAYIALAFALSAMLVSTNMFILVTQRQRELGVLKAIGASGRELFVLLLSETALFAIVGSLAGFALIMSLILSFVYLASDVTLLQAGSSVLTILARVLLLALGTGLLAGIVPAWYATRSTTMEVLNHE